MDTTDDAASVAGLDFAEAERRMEGALDSFARDLEGLRAGRAHSGLLESVTVNAYSGAMPLSHVATVSAPSARLLTVQVWDKSLVAAVEKALRGADLGLNPVVEGQMMRLPILPLTEERRKELAKAVGRYGEKARIAIRNLRRAAQDRAKAESKTEGEDNAKRLAVKVDKASSAFIARIDSMCAAKEKDILGE